MPDEGDATDGGARRREHRGSVAQPLASLAHALRNPVQALRHALYILRLPDLPAAEQRRMLALQERQVDVLAQAIETHLASPVLHHADDTPPPTVHSLVGAILRESSAAFDAASHRVTVRMEDPATTLLADERGVAREVVVRWREAVACQGGTSRSCLTVLRHPDHVDIQLLVEPDDGSILEHGVLDSVVRCEGRREGAGLEDERERTLAAAMIAPAAEACAQADVRIVYRTSLRLRPPHA